MANIPANNSGAILNAGQAITGSFAGFVVLTNSAPTVANNIAIDSTTFDIIINLYNPLPNNIGVTVPLWIVTKIADSLVFDISIFTFRTKSYYCSIPNPKEK
jgi:hypothetical protein